MAAYYYLRLLVVMYMKEPGDAIQGLPPLPAGTRAALWISAAFTLVMGIFPSLVLNYAIAYAHLGK